MARLAILSLGPLQITLGDNPVTGFDSDKARALLAYLAIEADRPHLRESLAGLLWPEFPEERARQSLSQALSNVRHVIGDRDEHQSILFLDVTRQALRFNRASDYWLDVERFTTLPNLRIHTSDPLQALRRLEEAAVVYRGAFLEGLSFGDSPAFEEWILVQREHFHRLMQHTLSRLVTGYSEQGELDRALDFAWRRVDLVPWHEEAHRQVMRLLAQTGQRAAALAHYVTCCALLRKELDVDPEAETVALVEAIRHGTLEVRSGHATTLQSFGAPLPKHNLPAQLLPLIGRETELAVLRARLKDPACRLVTLTGIGGIGKTRVALETATSLVAGFADGVFFVSLMPVHTLGAVAGAVAQSLGLTFTVEGGSEEQQLHDYLQHKTLLLVLDNVEHLLREAPQQDAVSDSNSIVDETRSTLVGLITNLLEGVPGLKIMATSRMALNVLGETLFPIHELDYPQTTTVSLAVAENVAAVRLFVQAAQQRRPDFALTEANVQAASAICRHLQGVPLPILLCASWVNVMSAADIAAQLTCDAVQAQELLETDWQTIPERQRSMRAVFNGTWRLLTEREQRIMQALSVLRGAFTQTTAWAITDATRKDLRGLVEASLIKRESTGRYTMHRLVQQDAESRLALDSAAAYAVHDRHCAYYTALLQGWAEDAKGPRRVEALLEMDAEISDVQAAWAWAVAQPDPARIGQAIEGLSQYYLSRQLSRQGEAACRSALERLEAVDSAGVSPSEEAVLARARVMQWHSNFLPPEQALASMERCLALLESPLLPPWSARREKAAALQQIAYVMGFLDRSAAIHLLDQSLALCRVCEDEWWEGRAHLGLGIQNYEMGDYEAARHHLEASLVILRRLEDQASVAEALQLLSFVAWSTGECDECVHLATAVLAQRRALGDRREIADALWGLTLPYIFYFGSFEKVWPLLEDLQGLSRDLPDIYGAAGHGLRAWAKMYAGDYLEAQTEARIAVDQFRTLQDWPGAWTRRRHWAVATALLGLIALALEQYAEALSLLETSIAAYRALQRPQDVAVALAGLSVVLWAQDRIAEAGAHLTEALQLGVETKDHLALVHGLVGTALFLLHQNDNEHAIELIAAVFARFPLLEASRWFWDVAIRHVEVAAESLPTVVVAAAKTRGQMRDLHATAVEMLAELKGTARSA
ncbi:MAG: putative HTH-type transcriptional regulator [Chloroflexi bacterium ADurb.Bin360]|nr:MAG: putative HTH-type transcriptional regulator [Chloroflexi bacterium ADurb.Bin360]